MKPLAALFDVDGVLVETCEIHYEALNRALKSLNIEPISREAHFERYNGKPTKVKLDLLEQERGPLGKTAVKSFGSSDSPLWIVDERLRITTLKNDYTLRLLEQYIEVDERKIKMLEKLRDNEIRLAACSNAIRSSVHKMLSLAGIRDFFEVVLSNEDVTHPKPHPEIYSTAAQRLGIPIDQCVVIEDSPVGIEAAYAAGAEEVVVVPSAKYVDEGLADFILSKNEFMRVEEFLEEASH